MKKTPTIPKLPTLQAVSETINRTRHSGSGMSCSFYEMTKSIGVKLFHNAKRARMTHAMHVFAMNHSKYGMKVPKAYGGVFKVINDCGKARWGYFVQIVKVGSQLSAYVSNNFENKAIYLGDVLKKFFQKRFTKWRSWFSSRKTWLKYLRNIFTDTHESNWGIYRGKLVWLDFSFY